MELLVYRCNLFVFDIKHHIIIFM